MRASSPLRYYHAVQKISDMVFSLYGWYLYLSACLFLVFPFLSLNKKQKQARIHSLIHTESHTYTHVHTRTHEQQTHIVKSTFYQQTMLTCSSIHLFFLNIFFSVHRSNPMVSLFMLLWCIYLVASTNK